MTNEEREMLFKLLKKAKVILPRSQYIAVERGSDNSLILYGVRVSSYAGGSNEYMDEDDL